MATITHNFGKLTSTTRGDEVSEELRDRQKEDSKPSPKFPFSGQVEKALGFIGITAKTRGFKYILPLVYVGIILYILGRK